MKALIDLFQSYNQSSQKYLTQYQWWLKIMIVVNFVFPLLLINHPPARVTLLSSVVAVAIGLLIYRLDGYRRLLALMHAPWVFLVWYLMPYLSVEGDMNPLRIWLWSIVIVNSISLVLDARDLWWYYVGKKDYPT